MPDKWDQYAAAVQPTSVQKTPDDPWEQYAAKPSSPAPQGNSGFFGPIQDAYDDAVARPPQAEMDAVGPIGRGFANVGRHVLQAAAPIFHPEQTAQALMGGTHRGDTLKDTPGYKMISGIADDYKQHGPVEGTEDLAGDALGAYLGGKAAEAPTLAGAPMERIGYGAINDALGARGPKPFQYGHNPARGALDEGVVPAMTKQASSEAVGPAMDRVGGRIADAVGSSNATIPLRFLRTSIENPINEARAVMEGPGGGAGRNPAPLDELQRNMANRAPSASAPIYGPNAGTQYSPQETVQAMAKPLPKALPAPMEDIPLSEPKTVNGRPSKPLTLTSNRALPRDSPFYGADTSTRLAPGMSFVPPESEFPPAESFGNLGPNEYIGGKPGQRGGVQPPSGVLRRPSGIMDGPEQPSQFTNLRHDTTTPSDLWHTIHNIDKNTRFNPQPEIEGLNDVRRDIRGGMSGNLKDAVPEVAPHMQTYGDLAGARDAIDRTIHSGQSLSKIMDLIKYPTETYGGAGLVRGGQMLQRLDPRFLRTIGAAPGIAAPLLKQGEQ